MGYRVFIKFQGTDDQYVELEFDRELTKPDVDVCLSDHYFKFVKQLAPREVLIDLVNHKKELAVKFHNGLRLWHKDILKLNISFREMYENHHFSNCCWDEHPSQCTMTLQAVDPHDLTHIDDDDDSYVEDFHRRIGYGDDDGPSSDNSSGEPNKKKRKIRYYWLCKRDHSQDRALPFIGHD